MGKIVLINGPFKIYFNEQTSNPGIYTVCEYFIFIINSLEE